MRYRLLFAVNALFTSAAACSSHSGTGSPGDAMAPGRGVTIDPLVQLSGAVSDPLGEPTNVRLVVGVARPADVPQFVYCDRFIVRKDFDLPTLPGTYSITGLPLGSYVFVALFLGDAATSLRAPYATYPITVDAGGVHVLSPDPTNTLNIAAEGTIGYACS